MKKRAPSCVYRHREGQVRDGGGARAAVAAWCTWHGGTAWLGVAGDMELVLLVFGPPEPTAASDMRGLDKVVGALLWFFGG